jgi:hypothetical protein
LPLSGDVDVAVLNAAISACGEVHCHENGPIERWVALCHYLPSDLQVMSVKLI